MDNWKFTATKQLVEAIGEDWNGTYEIRLLTATEYLGIGEEIIDSLRQKGKTQIKPEDLKQSQFNFTLLCKSVLHNGKPVNQDIPSKLVDLLMPLVLRRNTMQLEEQQQLFLQPITDNPAMQPKPTT